jgi:ABC-type transport system involved in multi-copper enzyme maturation permease subunit
MVILPIIERELRVAARRRSAFWTRLIAAGVAIGLGAWTVWFGEGWRSSASLGGPLFTGLSFLAFVFCWFAGPIFTADLVSEERRDGTLGLLFLTDLAASDVALGKLATASVTAVFSLLAVVPVLAIPILLGGLALDELGRIVLVLLNTLFLSLAAGLMVSAGSRHTRSAMAATFLLLLVLTGAPPLLAQFLVKDLGWSKWFEAVAGLSPGFAYFSALTANYSRMAPAFWASVAGLHLLGWGFIGLSCWLLPRVWREGAGGRLALAWRQRWQRWSYRNAAARAGFRRRVLELNPVQWLAGRHRLKRRLLWSFYGLAAAVWLVVLLVSDRSKYDLALTFAAALLFQSPFKWLVASEASWRWFEDRRNGALELLLTTPLSVRDILAGQMRALRSLFLFPVACLLAVETLALVVGAGPSESQRGVALMLGVVILVFVWDLHALSWLGTWLGLVRTKPMRAFFAAVFWVLILPWLIFLAFMLVAPSLSDLDQAIVFLTPCALINSVSYVTARRNLYAKLRLVAAGQLEAQPAPLLAGQPA